jgi:hypothetical protein
MKDVQVKKVHPALKREHPALQNNTFLNFFLLIVGHVCPLGSGSEYSRPKSKRIRIQHICYKTTAKLSQCFLLYMPLGKDLVYADLYKTRSIFFSVLSIWKESSSVEI